MANYQICRRYLTAFRTGKLRITCYWIQGKPSRDMWTLLSRTFYEYVTRIWRGYPSLLGEWQQDNLCWNYHIEQTVKKAMNRLYYLRECRKAKLPTEIRVTTIYSTKIRPLFECVPSVGRFSDYLAEELQSIQIRCLDIIGIPRTSLPMSEDRCKAYRQLSVN